MVRAVVQIELRVMVRSHLHSRRCRMPFIQTCTVPHVLATLTAPVLQALQSAWSCLPRFVPWWEQIVSAGASVAPSLGKQRRGSKDIINRINSGVRDFFGLGSMIVEILGLTKRLKFPAGSRRPNR